MTAYETLQQQIKAEPKAWLITGVAGFIGSNLLEALLKLDQQVVGLDNFSTGHGHNLDEVKQLVSPAQWAVVKGTAEIANGEMTVLLTKNQSTYAPLGTVHRLSNRGTIPREIIEVQSVSYLGEADIVRLEDHYGR